MKNVRPASPIVWIDLEMTGLIPERHTIVEIATIVTDSQLVILAEGPELVIHHDEAVLADMNPFSREHHAASGLTARIRSSTLALAEAEALTLDFVARHCRPGEAPLGGNSVYLDRYFLAQHMPTLEAHLHPHNVDVSSVKELSRRWFPEALATAPPKADRHRALADIRESIQELRYFRQAVFR